MPEQDTCSINDAKLAAENESCCACKCPLSMSTLEPGGLEGAL